MSNLGIVLLLLAAALAATEAHVPSHGALGGPPPRSRSPAGSRSSWPARGSAPPSRWRSGWSRARWPPSTRGSSSARRSPSRAGAVRSGAEGLIGRVGEVRAAPEPLGQVFLDGALWRARLWAGDEDAVLERGDPIVVERVDGLTLTVRRAEEWEVAP